MADYNSSLPVRTQSDGTDERLHVKIVDGTNPAVNQATVDADKNLHVEIHGNNPAAGDETLRLSEQGAITPDGVYDVANNTVPGNIGVIGHTRAVGPAGTDQVERITAKQGTVDTTVHAMDVSLHDENGNAYTTTNPLPVVSQEDEGGTDIHFYEAVTALAAGATTLITELDYLVTNGTTLRLRKLVASGSGKIKVDFLYGVPATPTVLATFFNSTAEPNIDHDLSMQTLEVTGDGTNKIIARITNRDNQAQDVYFSFYGREI